MKKLKFLLLIFIIFICPNVFAYDYNVTDIITSPIGGPNDGRYTGLEIYNSGTTNVYTVNTRYNGRLSQIIYNLRLPTSYPDSCMTTNMTYTITMEMATQDWANNFAKPFVSWSSSGENWVTGNVTYVSNKKIYFTFKIPTTYTTCVDFVYVRLNSTNLSNIAFTQITNWNLSKVTLSDQYSTGGAGSSGGSSGGSSSTTNCTNVSKTYNYSNSTTTGSYLNSIGELISDNEYGIIQYITILPNDTYTLTKSSNTDNLPSYCLYDSSKTLISCTSYSQQSSLSISTGNARYISLSIHTGHTLTLTHCVDPNQSVIDNDNQNTQSIIDNQNNNTQNIIDNANQNSQNIIDSQKACIDKTYKYSDATTTGVLTDSGSINSNSSSFKTTDFIPINDYFVISNRITTASMYYCLYDSSKTLISCTRITANGKVNVASNVNYIKVSIRNTDVPQYTIHQCVNGNQAITDVLTDDSDPNIDDSEFTALFDSVSINNPVSSLLQLPVQFINAIVNQSNSCQVVNLGTLLGVPITLPCIDIGSIVGSTVWDTIDVLSSIGLIVLILKQIYESITNALTLGGYMEAKKGGLGYMPPLEFLCSILTGFGGDM